jgi:hypothetical protein
MSSENKLETETGRGIAWSIHGEEMRFRMEKIRRSEDDERSLSFLDHDGISPYHDLLKLMSYFPWLGFTVMYLLNPT